jgi:hypothetical protein
MMIVGEKTEEDARRVGEDFLTDCKEDDLQWAGVSVLA